MLEAQVHSLFTMEARGKLKKGRGKSLSLFRFLQELFQTSLNGFYSLGLVWSLH